MADCAGVRNVQEEARAAAAEAQRRRQEEQERARAQAAEAQRRKQEEAARAQAAEAARRKQQVRSSSWNLFVPSCVAVLQAGCVGLAAIMQHR
jgi:hypothetical protein